MSTVLLATDGSDLATEAMRRGVELMGPDHQFLTLAVVPPAFVPTASVGPMETHPTLVDPELEHQLEDQQRAVSATDLSELDEQLSLITEHVVETGDPGPTICDVAASRNADVVVIGSHGHGWLQRVLLGSVSAHVLHHAPCAVMVIRTSGPQD